MDSASPLRIVHVTFGLDVGGLEKLLLEFAHHVQPARGSLLFVSLGANGAVCEELRQLGWPVVCLHKPAGFHPSIFTQLARLFRGARANVVHTHDARALIYGAPAARLAGVANVIHTQHGQGLGLSPRQLWLLRMAARAAKRFVCVSRNAAEIAREQFRIPADKLCTIHNGINVERFALDEPDSCVFGSDGPLVAVARLSPEKGVDLLLQATALAREATPDLRVEIAGDGPCRDALLRQRDVLGLDDCVEFLGQVDDIAGLLQGARLFVLPSRSEGIALTLLEAMAAGVAVVATRVGGSEEVVIDDQTGVLTPPGDPQALARVITRLWSDPEERERLATAGRWRVRELFNVERMVRDYECLYRGKTPEATVHVRPIDLRAEVAPAEDASSRDVRSGDDVGAAVNA